MTGYALTSFADRAKPDGDHEPWFSGRAKPPWGAVPKYEDELVCPLLARQWRTGPRLSALH